MPEQTTWRCTVEDGCRVYRAVLDGRAWEVVELYEEGLDGVRWQCNADGWYKMSGRTAAECKRFAEQYVG